jgi:hypothetical protein
MLGLLLGSAITDKRDFVGAARMRSLFAARYGGETLSKHCVDFRWRGASLPTLNFVKITRLKKTFAALGIALFFTFGAFAVSLAYESVPVGPLYTGELQYLLTTGPAPLYARLLTACWQFDTAYMPEPTRPCSEASRFTNIDFVEQPTRFPLIRIHAAKVSLQILKSALLL